MAKGKEKRQDFVKPNEKASQFNVTPDQEDLSPIDRGKDFIKAGER